MNWAKTKSKLQTKKDESFLISFSRYNSFLVICWALCVSLLLYYSFSQHYSYRFMGVAEAHQYRVQFENPVVIEKILVESGQEIRKGDILMKLMSSKLASELATNNMEISAKFSEYKLYNNKFKNITRFKEAVTNKDEQTLLEKEILSLLEIQSITQKQIDKLEVRAPFDGYVGTLNFILGEVAPSFSPVAYITEKSATVIKSYVLEDDPAMAKVRVGQEVEIYRTSGIRGGTGKVFQIGTEVRELPVRFQKTGYDTAYGKEVLVKIEEGLELASGERVSVEFSD